MVKHLKVGVLHPSHGRIGQAHDRACFIQNILRHSDAWCIVCGGRGHTHKSGKKHDGYVEPKCKSEELILRAIGKNSVMRALWSNLKKVMEHRYKARDGSDTISRGVTDNRTGGDFRGKLLRDILR